MHSNISGASTHAFSVWLLALAARERARFGAQMFAEDKQIGSNVGQQHTCVVIPLVGFDAEPERFEWRTYDLFEPWVCQEAYSRGGWERANCFCTQRRRQHFILGGVFKQEVVLVFVLIRQGMLRQSSLFFK